MMDGMAVTMSSDEFEELVADALELNPEQFNRA
jgi:predicted Zn-dependent protease with MMP-like domain